MFAYFILTWICVFFFILSLKFRRPKNFPPGPTPLPILGNLLNLSVHNPMRDLERLRKSYGNVYSLFIGPKPIVVINGMQALKEAMLTKAYFSLQLYDSTPIIRNLPLPFMKGFKNMEVSILLNVPFIISLVCCATLSFLGVTQVSFLLSQTLKKLITGVITEHRETIVPGKPRDILDCYLDELEKSDSDDSSFSEDKLVMFILHLMFAGTETLLSGFLYLNTLSQLQEQCQQELDRVLGNKDHASYDDRHNMPCTLAVIHEVQRTANTVPFSVYHLTTKDTKPMGYSLPKVLFGSQGTVVIPNMKSVLNEEGQWKFPHEFNPENFLNDEGEFVQPEAFMPFCAGPRMCPGERLAQMKFFLIIVTLLRKFKCIWPEDAGEPDYTPVMGVTLSPHPYRIKVQLRTTQ
ncbi:hypothetical protein F7725_028700 [Dissostichus mawsoni]|uniref:Cytochrome P450 n=1 Tax=Dissostichus mawsoni TaxID=36200 RepID=A0A7J5XGE1_DISMA|nr:hypothetical protein F7725_028700 [Dissostichus mawsoni]